MDSWVDVNIRVSVTLTEVKELSILRPSRLISGWFFLVKFEVFPASIQASKKMGDEFILSMIGGCNAKNLGGLRFLPSPE